MPARKETDRRVRKVLTMLAAAQAYDDVRRERGNLVEEGEVDFIIHNRLFRFVFDNWPAERMREFVVAALTNAPSDMLDAWMTDADEYLESHRKILAEEAADEIEEAA